MSSEKTYKKLTTFLLQGVNTFLSVLKILIQSKLGNKLPKAKDKVCYVLANGPSLKKSLETHYEKISKRRRK